ncbi:MAG: hypothetical protein HC831_18430 [Chloroflexia bacterium]|nr:hypothetical protein [Chloroflexia bacterium]
MHFVLYIFFRLFIWLASVTPFRLLYIISDAAFHLFYHVFHYRRKVVCNNLRKSFPEKGEVEIKILEKNFYKYLTDIFFESLKGMSLNEAQLEQRHRYVNPEVINKFLAKGQSVLGVAAHYGNWEWGAFSGAGQFLGKMIAFYKPINNRIIDRYLVKHRARFNCHMASIGETYYTFKHFQNEVVTYFMVADQSPSNLRRSYWFNFLNQDTAFIHGPEDYSRVYNLPVVFIEIKAGKTWILRGLFQSFNR